MWTYTNIYKAIIKYIGTNLRNTDYVLYFGVVAIATQSPQAFVKFCLKNIQTNKQKRWTVHLTGETIQALEANVIMLLVKTGNIGRVVSIWLVSLSDLFNVIPCKHLFNSFF